MRIQRPSIRERRATEALRATTALLALPLVLSSAPAAAQSATGNVIVNPAFSGSAGAVAGAYGTGYGAGYGNAPGTGYGAGYGVGYGAGQGAYQPPANAAPPAVGSPLQLPPAGMPRSQMTLTAPMV